MGLQSDAGMALIPAGDFWMGRNHFFLFDEFNWTLRPRLDDRPVHQVDLDAFYIDKHEVTNAEYERFTEATQRAKPWHWPGGKVTKEQEKKPVYNVSWFDADAYCKWDGKRLPTEAEWEKAARGGLDRKLYSWGDVPIPGGAYVPPQAAAATGQQAAPKAEPAADPQTPQAAAKQEPAADPQTPQPAAKQEPAADPQAAAKQPPPAAGRRAGVPEEPKRGRWEAPNGPADVGSFPPNGYGLFDMTGNVWEWVSDWYDKDYYLETEDKNPQGPESGKYKVARGGGWDSKEDMPQRSILGVHYRNYADPSDASNVLGLRCAKSAENSKPQ